MQLWGFSGDLDSKRVRSTPSSRVSRRSQTTGTLGTAHQGWEYLHLLCFVRCSRCCCVELARSAVGVIGPGTLMKSAKGIIAPQRESLLGVLCIFSILRRSESPGELHSLDETENNRLQPCRKRVACGDPGQWQRHFQIANQIFIVAIDVNVSHFSLTVSDWP